MKEKIKYMAKSKKAKAAATDTAEEQTGATVAEVITEVRTADKNGNQFLPGQEQQVKVIPELRDAIKHEKLVLVPAFMDAQKELSVWKKSNQELVEKYKDQFEHDADRGVYVYDDGEVKIEVQEKDTISYEVKKEES